MGQKMFGGSDNNLRGTVFNHVKVLNAFLSIYYPEALPPWWDGYDICPCYTRIKDKGSGSPSFIYLCSATITYGHIFLQVLPCSLNSSRFIALNVGNWRKNFRRFSLENFERKNYLKGRVEFGPCFDKSFSFRIFNSLASIYL